MAGDLVSGVEVATAGSVGLLVESCDQDGMTLLFKPGNDGDNLFGGFPLPVDHFGEALPQDAMMIEASESEVFGRKIDQTVESVFRRDGAVCKISHELSEAIVHGDVVYGLRAGLASLPVLGLGFCNGEIFR